MKTESDSSRDLCDDKPQVLSVHRINSKKNFLPSSLIELHHEGIEIIKKNTRDVRDPRFDPNVEGVCILEDWAHLEEERKIMIKNLKLKIAKCRNEDQLLKLKAALTVLKQREATINDINLQRKVKKEIKDEQIAQLNEGKKVKFLSKSELKEKIVSERLKNMSKKKKDKYLNKKKKFKDMPGE